MTERVTCPSQDPVRTWTVSGKKRGKCTCGFEGWVSVSGRLYRHTREVRGFVTYGIDSYKPSYDKVDMLLLCNECGATVSDQDAHDDWHTTVVEDQRLLRKKVEWLETVIIEMTGAEPEMAGAEQGA